MKFFNTDIVKLAKENRDFRRVLYTAMNSQLVLMKLGPGEEVGMEHRDATDQIFYFVQGKGRAVIDGRATPVDQHDVLVVPAGSLYNVLNRTDGGDLRFFTIYSPPAHPPGTIHRTRAEAEADEPGYAPKRNP